MRQPTCVGMLVLALGAAGAPAAGAALTGAVFGCDLGYGSGRVDYDRLVDGVRFAEERGDGVALGLQAGYRFHPRLTASATLDAWLGAVEDVRVGFPDTWRKDDDWSLTGLGVALAWRIAGNAFTRAGLGRATGSVTFADDIGAEQVFRDHGLAWRLGAGYAWHVADDFALVPTVEWRRFEFGDGERADVWAATLGAAFF